MKPKYLKTSNCSLYRLLLLAGKKSEDKVSIYLVVVEFAMLYSKTWLEKDEF